MVPTLETPRLRLRLARETDLGAHAAMLGDPEVMRFIGGKPHAREEAWRRLLMGPGLWPLLGFGYWTIERRAGGAYLGQVGFADFKRDMKPSVEGIPEMGWLLAPEAQGQGIATEAVRAALAWADEALSGREFAAIIAPGNEPSIRLARKVGFSVCEDALYKGEPTLLFRRPAR